MDVTMPAGYGHGSRACMNEGGTAEQIGPCRDLSVRRFLILIGIKKVNSTT